MNMDIKKYLAVPLTLYMRLFPCVSGSDPLTCVLARRAVHRVVRVRQGDLYMGHRTW